MISSWLTTENVFILWKREEVFLFLEALFLRTTRILVKKEGRKGGGQGEGKRGREGGRDGGREERNRSQSSTGI